jgi:acetyl-CoA acetyltransferase
MSYYNKVAIVGADECDVIGSTPDKSAQMIQAEAARNALRDAGLDKKDVDGLFCAGNQLALGEYLGIVPKYSDGTAVGGSSYEFHVAHAASAIANGLCEVALVVHGETGGSNRGRRGGGRPAARGAGGGDASSASAQFETPYGTGGAPTTYSMACKRHMHQYGTTHEQLGEIAIATRKWAQLNPKAMMRDPLTMEDYLASRWITYPFHIYDCCLVTDAAGAVVVTSAERAKSLKKKPAWVLGTGEAHTHASLLNMPDLTQTPARHSGPRALAMAGVKHSDLDVVEVYDSFTYTALVTIEELGFCKKGEGGAFLSGQRTAPGGDFPMNTNGGGLSYTHPGQYGMFILIEAVRQLRGESGERQVKDAKLALVNGTGGTMSSTCTLILGVD